MDPSSESTDGARTRKGCVSDTICEDTERVSTCADTTKVIKYLQADSHVGYRCSFANIGKRNAALV